ncbi:hypothetical protein AYL99_11828 [Fonsecaea erecta]|uniref:Uncharacterized protein n=1 Tax=Fonsecaea erecta TaxID=1367422 RepID=A0A178Z2B7_9EURO|nr:hypothetical protein AYL99_11828 [Fonsecaea erecta]OAP53948.1 hypothetical protein AYL99_11828 [Fonsecaea erecta]
MDAGKAPLRPPTRATDQPSRTRRLFSRLSFASLRLRAGQRACPGEEATEDNGMNPTENQDNLPPAVPNTVDTSPVPVDEPQGKGKARADDDHVEMPTCVIPNSPFTTGFEQFRLRTTSELMESAMSRPEAFFSSVRSLDRQLRMEHTQHEELKRSHQMLVTRVADLENTVQRLQQCNRNLTDITKDPEACAESGAPPLSQQLQDTNNDQLSCSVEASGRPADVEDKEKQCAPRGDGDPSRAPVATDQAWLEDAHWREFSAWVLSVVAMI